MIEEIEKGKLDNYHLQKLVALLKVKVSELEEEIRELKQEKEDAPEFNEYISKKENELQENKWKLKKLMSYGIKDDGKHKTKNPNSGKFPTSWVAGGIILVFFGLLLVMILIINNKNKKNK